MMEKVMELLADARRRMNRLKDSRGQNTVEYLLMLTVVVGVVLVAGMALKKFMPGLFGSISSMISGAAGSLGSSQGN
jgi:Flp pilus assembly pilin Flp